MYTRLQEVCGREEQFKGHSEKSPAKTRMQLIFKINNSIPSKNKTQCTKKKKRKKKTEREVRKEQVKWNYQRIKEIKEK